MLFDLIYRARDFLRGKGIECTCKRLDTTTGKEGTVIRMVGQQRTSEYMSGSVHVDAIYQILARYNSESVAESKCTEAAEALEGIVLESANGSFVFDHGEQELYTYPQEIGMDSGMYVWEARVLAPVRKGA